MSKFYSSSRSRIICFPFKLFVTDIELPLLIYEFELWSFKIYWLFYSLISSTYFNLLLWIGISSRSFISIISSNSDFLLFLLIIGSLLFKFDRFYSKEIIDPWFCTDIFKGLILFDALYLIEWLMKSKYTSWFLLTLKKSLLSCRPELAWSYKISIIESFSCLFLLSYKFWYSIIVLCDIKYG